LSGSSYLITSVTGTWDESSISSIIAAGGFAYNTNRLLSGTPQLNEGGVSFATAAGTYVNLGYYTTSEDAQAQGYGAIINTPPRLCSNCFPTVTGFGTFTATQVPEIDPTSAASGLALLIGGVAVLRGRRQQSVA
jgi:hypothetical protein